MGGAAKTLKHFKEDKDEIGMGLECGVGLDFELMEEGDVIQCVEWYSKQRKIPVPAMELRDDLQESLWQGKDYVPPPRPDSVVEGYTLKADVKGDWHYEDVK